MILHGNNMDILKTYSENYFDAVVTDPPYGWKFMNRHWDYDIPSIELWSEVLRVLKPGAHLLCACGARTQHRMTVNIEDAGFEIRDVITWHYGSGFPKSLDISKAIDKQARAEREVIEVVNKLQSYGHEGNNCFGGDIDRKGKMNITAASTDAAKEWQGWGTALKPASEFWTLARKPLGESTIAGNVLKHGTGGININGCRIEGELQEGRRRHGGGIKENHSGFYMPNSNGELPAGRFPSNLVFSCDCEGPHQLGCPVGSTGTASRFFYVAKSSKAERNKGLSKNEQNGHCTVKPVSLMRYLCRLITPPKGIILDPFNGSGSTGVAAALEWFEYIGIEQDETHVKVSEKRQPAPDLFT